MKRILITSDDGYFAPGVKILTAVLKSEYELKIAGTDTQQSGVGAMLHMRNGGTWGVTEADGVEVLHVDGSPVDAIECAQAYFDSRFDLVISGINWGENIGGAMLASGTVSAAAWGVNIGLAPRSMAFSWQMDPKYWSYTHTSEDQFPDEWFEYPGRTVGRLIKLAIEKNMWGAQMLNINLPAKKTTKLKFAKPVSNLTRVYWYPADLNRQKHTFSYVPKYAKKPISDQRYDYPIMKSGKIAIMPCQVNYFDHAVWERVNGLEIELV